MSDPTVFSEQLVQQDRQQQQAKKQMHDTSAFASETPAEGDVLQRSTLSDVLTERSRHFVFVRRSTKVVDALMLMKLYNFTSLPVAEDVGEEPSGFAAVFSVESKDRQASNIADGPFIGIVNLLDICGVLTLPFAPRATFNDLDQLKMLTAEEFVQGVNLNLTVGEVLGTTNESSLRVLWKAPAREPLNVTIDILSAGMHRLLVHDDQTGEYGLLSQTDLLRWLVQHKDELQPFFSTKADLFMSPSLQEPLQMLYEDMTALQAAYWLWYKELGAVGVLDRQTGQLIGTFSASDLRGLTVDNLFSLLYPLSAYLKKIHGGTIRIPVTCNPNHSLLDVARLALERQVHRVWIVSEDGTPAGVITMSDMLRVFTADFQKKISRRR